jgi:dethiobiotin synthetase
MSAAIPSPRSGLLLAGTDTGVGKTTLARGLLRVARERNQRLVPFKPVETGCDGNLPGDAAHLLEAASLPGLTLEEVCPYAFAAPVAPSIAARLETRSIDVEDVIRRAAGLSRRGDALLVETAGGLLSPWAPGFTAADLAARLGLPVLIVAANRLGVINHAALVAAECRRRQLPCIGFVLVNVAATPTPDAPYNASEIAAHTGMPVLGTLRHLPDLQTDMIAKQVATDLDLSVLLDAGRS